MDESTIPLSNIKEFLLFFPEIRNHHFFTLSTSLRRKVIENNDIQSILQSLFFSSSRSLLEIADFYEQNLYIDSLYNLTLSAEYIGSNEYVKKWAIIVEVNGKTFDSFIIQKIDMLSPYIFSSLSLQSYDDSLVTEMSIAYSKYIRDITKFKNFLFSLLQNTKNNLSFVYPTPKNLDIVSINLLSLFTFFVEIEHNINISLLPFIIDYLFSYYENIILPISYASLIVAYVNKYPLSIDWKIFFNNKIDDNYFPLFSDTLTISLQKVAMFSDEEKEYIHSLSSYDEVILYLNNYVKKEEENIEI